MFAGSRGVSNFKLYGKSEEKKKKRKEEDKAEILGNFFRHLFGDANSSRTVPSWIYTVWSHEELSKFRRIDGYLLRECLNAMRGGKSCSEEDMVVAEMLFLLSEEVLDLLAELLKDRLMNRQGNDDNPVWSAHGVSLIAKKGGGESTQRTLDL